MFHVDLVRTSRKEAPVRAIQIALATVVCCGPFATVAEGQKPIAPNDSMVVSTAWLAAHLTDRKVVLIEVTMAAAKARKQVFELGKFDLGLALAALGVLAEDVEDDGGAVDDFDPYDVLQCAPLARCQFAVDNDGIRSDAGDDVP